MKPLKLEIENVKSFRQRCVIDFTRLMESGIFGIFGNTGSGKSTILYCINLALYYTGANFDKKEIINTKSTEAFVGFSFELLNEGERKRYLVERTFGANTSDAYLYLLGEDTKHCISEKTNEVTKTIISLIGLTLEEFKKCIALPQGEFAAFINSTSAAKTDIIASLFSLQDYSEKIFSKTSERRRILNDTFIRINSSLGEYSDVDKQGLDNLKDEIKTQSQFLKQAEKDIKELELSIRQRLKIAEANAEYIAAKSRLENLSAQKPAVDDDRNLLEKSLKFGSVLSEYTALESSKKQIERLTDALSEILLKIKPAQAETERAKKAASERDFDLELKTAAEKQAQLTALKSTQNRITELEAEKDELKKDYLKLQGELNAQLNEKERLESSVIQTTAELEKLPGGDGTDKLKQYFLSAEYQDSLSYFSLQKTRLNSYIGGGSLYKKVSEEVDSRINHYTLLLKDTCLEADIDAEVEAVKRLRMLKEKLNQNILTAKTKIESLESSAADINKRLSELKSRGENTAKVIAGLKGELLQATNGAPLNELTLRYENLSQKIIEQRKSAAADYERAFAILSGLLMDERGISERISALKKEYAQRRELFQAKLEQSGIAGITGAEKYNLSDEEQERIKNRIAKFDEQSAALNSRIKELKKLTDFSVTEEELTLQENSLLSAQKKSKQTIESIAAANSTLKYKSGRLEIKQELSKQLKEAQEKLNVAERLYKMVSKKKFMEFVAEEYLSDLAQTATRLMLELTTGRYSLTYERLGAESDFFVSDNYDEGKLRKVSTLSGGETFLVSLALAVSLSETIYKKSLRPMEFFFLDEGFGTLDDELIEIVLSSLEKLKNTHFSIGLISHVKELKERIVSKINVTAADADNGTCVELIN